MQKQKISWVKVKNSFHLLCTHTTPVAEQYVNAKSWDESWCSEQWLVDQWCYPLWYCSHYCLETPNYRKLCEECKWKNIQYHFHRLAEHFDTLLSVVWLCNMKQTQIHKNFNPSSAILVNCDMELWSCKFGSQRTCCTIGNDGGSCLSFEVAWCLHFLIIQPFLNVVTKNIPDCCCMARKWTLLESCRIASSFWSTSWHCVFPGWQFWSP